MDNNNYKILSVGKGETIVDLRMITICMAAYLLAFWAVGQFGSEMKELIITNLNETAIGGGFFLLLWLILKIYYKADYLYNANIERERTASFTMRGASALPKQTERDDKYTAAHESGHALVYAALGCLPPGIELVIKDNVGIDGSLGYISGINSDHQLNEKTFSEWLMLVFLAGKYGESFAFGENTLGSTNDHQRWLNLAKTYLSNHFDGIFYSDPQNKFEQELNEEKLKKLQCSQKKMLHKLFSNNAQVFESLSAELLKKRKMGREELIPHLSRVVLSDDFPMPLGVVNEFKREWLEELGLYVDNDRNPNVRLI